MKGLLFSEVLRKVDDNGLDWKDVVCRIAEKHPETVAKIVADYESKDAWKREVRLTCGQGQKVAAIKVMRELTGAGLKEAKEWVEGDSECVERGGWNYVPIPVGNPFRE